MGRPITNRPPAAAVLRRALLGWGLGHLALGDRRGLILLALQPVAVAATALISAQLIDGTRWLAVFPPLAALLVIWLGQALHAHQRAIELGSAPGGELQVAMFLPLAVAVLTAFWLLGGRHGSPSATLEAYVLAWLSGRPEAAASVYAVPRPDEQLKADWEAQNAHLTERIRSLVAIHGVSSGLDAERPFNSLRFREPVADASGRQMVGVDIVRRERVETLVFGLIPTASQQTVVIEQAGTIWLRLQEQQSPEWLGVARLRSDAWRIDQVVMPGP